MKKLKNELKSLLKPIFSKKGEIFAELLLNWDDIMGSIYSQKMTPTDYREYISNDKKSKLLTVLSNEKHEAVNLKFSETIFIDRINTYFGFKAITKINFR